MDIAAKLAQLRAQKAAEFSSNVDKSAAKQQETSNEDQQTKVSEGSAVSSTVVLALCFDDSKPSVQPNGNVESVVVSTQTPTTAIGTARTSQIDHLDFLSKVQELEQAIHHTHPHMPVLLMKIHKQITADPELVTVLSEEEIGIIVNGLKIQTKTELVGTITKQAKSRDKKTKLDVSMF